MQVYIAKRDNNGRFKKGEKIKLEKKKIQKICDSRKNKKKGIKTPLH